MPALQAILRDRYAWKYHAAALGLSLSVLLFTLIQGVTVALVLPTVIAVLIVGGASFWMHPATYRNRGVPDADRPDRVEPDRMGTVQVLDPRVAVAIVSRNAMGIPVYTPVAESSYDSGGLIGGSVTVPNDTGRPIRIYSQEQLVRFRRLLRAARIASAPTKDDPYFRRGTLHFREAVRILGPRARVILASSVRQINGRYLKADQFVIDESGFPVRDAADGVKTKSVRIPIPRDSWLRKDFKHPKR